MLVLAFHSLCTMQSFIRPPTDQDEIKDTGMMDEIKFKCKAKTEDAVSEMKDEIKFKVSTNDEGLLKVKVEYEQEIETEESETETETQYEVLYGSLVEYKPAGSSATEAYDWDTTTVVNETPLTMGSFSAVTDDGSSYTFSITSTDGTAMFTFTISRGGEDEHVTANKMKIDFELMGYQWTETETNMALLSTIESQREIEIEYEDDGESEDNSDEIAVKSGPGSSKKAEEVTISFAEAMETTGVNVFGEYTWAKDATVRSVNDTDTADVVIEVVATSPADGSDAVAFSFVGNAARLAEDIFWDPEVGVAYAASGVASAVIQSSLALFAGATLMLLF